MKLTRGLAIALETVGCCITLAGVVTEFITGADYGYVIITGGALMVAFGSMIFAKCVKRNWNDEDTK
ncbi:histidine kinase [Dehalococcoides mccartyi]|uniref:histidine kinase n=1 Tax=Dehalococcoides mccartyi TaxID=61435 RepID=UPI00098EAB2B|nr:histidine kinase [Dehalococcoides mccartyi]AQU05310.1 histidine kinase [Dehalococcoides mccartyi]AQU06763.1 histidine kinase [Dehalococcoides mccartyi]